MCDRPLTVRGIMEDIYKLCQMYSEQEAPHCSYYLNHGAVFSAHFIHNLVGPFGFVSSTILLVLISTSIHRLLKPPYLECLLLSCGVIHPRIPRYFCAFRENVIWIYPKLYGKGG